MLPHKWVFLAGVERVRFEEQVLVAVVKRQVNQTAASVLLRFVQIQHSDRANHFVITVKNFLDIGWVLVNEFCAQTVRKTEVEQSPAVRFENATKLQGLLVSFRTNQDFFYLRLRWELCNNVDAFKGKTRSTE